MKKLVLTICFLCSMVLGYSQCSPTLKEIYNFKEGDKFTYITSNEEPGNGNPVYKYSYDTIYVLENISRDDTLRYVLNNKNKDSQHIDTLTIIDSINHPLNRCVNSYANVWSIPFFDSRRRQRWDSANLYLKVQVKENSDKDSIKYITGSLDSKGDFYKDSLGIKTLYERDEQYLENVSMRQEFKKGFGKMLDNFLLFEGHTSRKLIMLVRNGDTLLNLQTASINPKVLQYSITIYPNPTSSFIHLESVSPISTIKLFNALGQEVISQNQAYTINITSLPRGIYTLQLQTTNGIIRKKVYKN